MKLCKGERQGTQKKTYVRAEQHPLSVPAEGKAMGGKSTEKGGRQHASRDGWKEKQGARLLSAPEGPLDLTRHAGQTKKEGSDRSPGEKGNLQVGSKRRIKQQTLKESRD